MLNKKVEKALNRQIQIEAESSQYYLAMASWAENQGYPGTSDFFYEHSEEERAHMLKLVKYVNERGGTALIPALKAPKTNFSSLTKAFEVFLDHETEVTAEINAVVHVCLSEKDYTTHNFMQWYVSEQIEEEALARMILDKVRLIGEDKGGLYLLDRDIVTMSVPPANQ